MFVGVVSVPRERVFGEATITPSAIVALNTPNATTAAQATVVLQLARQ